MTNEDWKGIIYVMILVSGAVITRFGHLSADTWDYIQSSNEQPFPPQKPLSLAQLRKGSKPLPPDIIPRCKNPGQRAMYVLP